MSRGRCNPVSFAILLSIVFLGLAGHLRADATVPPAQLSLSQTDKAWLAAHPVIRLGIDANYAPYTFRDDQGQLQGVVSEFLAYLGPALGIRFEIIADLDWPQLMEAVRERRLDAVATVVRLPERDAFLEFTRIYLPTPLVIMTRDDATQLHSLEDLARLRLVLVEGYSSSQQVTALYPDLRPNYVATPLGGLRAIASGRADAYIGALGVNTFLAAQHGINNLKVNAAFDMEQNGQRFGVRKDWPQLAHLLDQALAAMPVQRQAGIFGHWLPIHAKDIRRLGQPTLVTRLFPWLLGFIGVAVLGYLAMLLWNRQLQRELALRRAELERTQAIAHMGDWSLDVASGRVQWSDEIFQITGRPPGELDCPTLRSWTHPDSRDACDEYIARLETLPRGEHLPPLVTHLLRPDGSSRWLEITCATEFDARGIPCRYYGTALDISERKRVEEQVRHLAYFDPLTALPNRRLLMDRLKQAMAASSRSGEYGALLMLDLDHFKDLNDTQGHDVGDQLLTEVAHRLTASVRQEDTVARLGGDEYVVVAEALGMDESSAALQAEVIAEQSRHTLGQPYTLSISELPHHSTSSIGVTLFRGQEAAMDVLLKQADVALYQAKNAGRNTIRFFNPDMQAAINSRMEMEAALRRSLKQGELHLYYQPQVDGHGNRIGAEALLRWLPAGAKPVSPGQFIPLAEDTGLILPIGAWVLETACVQLKRWEANPQTRALTIAVNVSARQFHQADFVEQVWDQIKRSGINPALLKLELTESVVLDRVDDVVTRMLQLKALGVSFSLDDFGTGFSSLSYLKRLPLDQVKIDQSFVRDITRDPNDAAIVRAILAMSQSLGLEVIAEGVETEEQRTFLHQYGCKKFQGYLFGKPAPIEEWPQTPR